MKRFLIRTLVFLVPVLVIVILCEVGLRMRMTDYRYKNEWLLANGNTVRIFVLGSSHAYAGIDPTYFSLAAFNGSHMSQDLNYDEFIFRKFAPRMDSLQYLILPISYFTPYWKLEQSQDYGRVKNYMLYYDCPFHPFELRYRLETYSGLRPAVALKSLLGKESPRFYSDLGFLTKYSYQGRKKDWKDTGKAAAERHTDRTLDAALFADNLEHAGNIAALCEERGIKLILLTTPTYRTYRDYLQPEQHGKMHEFCQLLLSEYPNVEYLDLESDERFLEEDYYDADHLNERGARKLTELLDAYLQ